MLKSVALLTLAGVVSAQDVSQTGRWDLLGNNHVVCIHMATLPNGKVLCAERPHVTPYEPNPMMAGTGFVTTEFDTKSNEIKMTNAVVNPFCAGHAQMGNGNILFAGGDFPSNQNAAGETVLTDGRLGMREYVSCPPGSPDSCVGTWLPHADMLVQRWYPTVVTTYLGTQVIISGTLKNLDLANTADSNNPTYEYYPPKTDGVWPRQMAILNDIFPYNLYPISFQLPSGQVFLFVGNSTNLLDPATDALDTTSISPIIIEDKHPWIYPFTPTGFMLPLTIANNFTPAIMVCGGTRIAGDEADERCIGINFADANPQWSLSPPMPSPRVMPDSVMLPNGQIVVTNGAEYGIAGGAAGESYSANRPVFAANLFDPATNTWSTLASMKVPRMYHSTANLMADGRVLVGGSEEQNFPDWDAQRRECYPFAGQPACLSPFEMRMEVFSPPYLFLPVERPVIASAPTTSAYSTAFTVTTWTDAQAIDSVVLVRYSTSTHSTNTDQRLVELVFTKTSATELQVTSPLNGRIAPPGNYHMFLMRGGKPSIATTIRLTL